MIYDNLPKYHQIEANNLKGLQAGLVVAQMEVANDATFPQAQFNVVGSSDATKGKMIANGQIVTISADGIKDANATDPLFIVYNEPLNTVISGARYYATNTDEENLRLVQLMPGDEWMSDIDILGGTYPGHEHLAGRIVEITGESAMSNDDWFDVTTLADGTTAKHYMFIKQEELNNGKRIKIRFNCRIRKQTKC